MNNKYDNLYKASIADPEKFWDEAAKDVKWFSPYKKVLDISNPPFYTDEFETEDSARNTARFTTALSFQELVYGASNLLSETGIFSVIIPYKEEKSFVSLAAENDLFLNRICRVKGTETSQVKRSLLEFSFENKPLKEEDYILEINGITLQGLSDKMIASFRNEHVGYIFQFHQLLPEFTAIENICIPAFIGKKDRKETELKAKELLKFLGLENRMNHKPSELSGGEQQRVAVARALINNPSVILADEPSGNLDSASAESLHKLFFELRDTFNQTFIIVTHNEGLATMADRKLTMRDGVII